MDKVLGFSLGADDYVVKPFEPIELRARIQARIRSARDKLSAPLKVGPIRFELNQHAAYLMIDTRESDLKLTPLEYKLLYFLASNEGRVFNRRELLDKIQSAEVHVGEENVYTHISSLCRKLGAYASMIECIPSVGYRFQTEVVKMEAVKTLDQ